MNNEVQTIDLGGKPYVILPKDEYERLLVRDMLPPLPEPDENGTFPAVEYLRASVARSLIQRRVELGLSQAELSKLAGIRAETLLRVESGKYSPSVATVERIEKAFEMRAKANCPKPQNGSSGRRSLTLRGKKA